MREGLMMKPHRRMLSLSLFPNAEKHVVLFVKKKKSRRTFQTHCSHSWQRGSFLNEPAAFDSSSSELTARKVVAIRAGWMIVPSGGKEKKRIVAAKLFITKIQVPSHGTGFGSHHRHSPFFKHSRVWTISHVRHLIFKLFSWLLLFRVWTMPVIRFWCSTSASNSTSTATSSSGMMASFFEWETLPFTGSVDDDDDDEFIFVLCYLNYLAGIEWRVSIITTNFARMCSDTANRPRRRVSSG